MSIENTVRTLVAAELHVSPWSIRPETALLAGEIGPRKLEQIALRIGSAFNLLHEGEPSNYEVWTTVGCAIDTVERLLERKKERAA